MPHCHTEGGNRQGDHFGNHTIRGRGLYDSFGNYRAIGGNGHWSSFSTRPHCRGLWYIKRIHYALPLAVWL